MWKIKTWMRIQKRMFLLYLAEFYVMFEFPIRLLVNWLFFLTIWFWAGFFYMYAYAKRALNSTSKNKMAEREALSGRIWFWDVYRIW